MIPRQFPRMVLAETRKVFTSGSAIAAITIAVLVAIGAVFGVWQWGHMRDSFSASVNGQETVSNFTSSGEYVAGWALWARNFFLLPLFLLLATAGSVAGELGERTLRELVVRPVPRWSILAAKLLALCALSIVTLVVTLTLSLGLGAAFFGLDTAGGALSSLLLGYAASFLSDVGLISLTMLASMLVSSVGGVVVAMLLLLILDFGLGLLLKLLGAVGVEEAALVVPYTLGNALGCWIGSEKGWDPVQFGALGVYVVVSAVFAVARFHRMDVP